MKHVKNMVLAAALAMPAATATAQDATEHLVIIERYGYYPSKVYVKAGDTIRFQNQSSNWVRLFSDDPYDNEADYDPDLPCQSFVDEAGQDQGLQYQGEKDGFAIGWFRNGSERTMLVTSCTETKFYAPEVYNSGGTDWNVRFDLIVFGEAPNG